MVLAPPLAGGGRKEVRRGADRAAAGRAASRRRMGPAGGGVRRRAPSGRQKLPGPAGRRQLGRAGCDAVRAVCRGLSGSPGAAGLSPRRCGSAVRAGRGAGGKRRTLDRRTGDSRSRRSPALARRGPGGAGARIAAWRTATLPARWLRLAEGAVREWLRRRACRRHGTRQDRADPRPAGAPASGEEGGPAQPAGGADEPGRQLAAGGGALRTGPEAAGAARPRPSETVCGDCGSSLDRHDLSAARSGRRRAVRPRLRDRGAGRGPGGEESCLGGRETHPGDPGAPAPGSDRDASGEQPPGAVGALRLARAGPARQPQEVHYGVPHAHREARRPRPAAAAGGPGEAVPDAAYQGRGRPRAAGKDSDRRDDPARRRPGCALREHPDDHGQANP